MYLLIAYLKFLLKSTNQHGVHSPFVFRLLTQCFYKKEKSQAFQQIKAFRKEILNDDREIQVTDFGVGSRVFRSNQRKISAIAKNAGISKKRAILLNKLCRYLQIKKVLELGTSVGISSAAIATYNELHLTTLEGCPETARIAREYFKKYELNNIELKVGSFNNILETIASNRFPLKSKPGASSVGDGQSWGFDLIYFDGNHQKEATLSYFKKLLPLAHNDSVFIFDDIHWSVGMKEAWEEIIAHPQVTVSIDSFFWGLIFFRKEQEKEHFVLRL